MADVPLWEGTVLDERERDLHQAGDDAGAP
jgi:hypothetical protein